VFPTQAGLKLRLLIPSAMRRHQLEKLTRHIFFRAKNQKIAERRVDHGDTPQRIGQGERIPQSVAKCDNRI
jgi:hypothetical protein